ncbi:uncharacterized protein [Rutidosis leptorrhynchoides]|uniref:uncharacterized protein n=1 Tax=Rutidosis leptorrhynchoides TaxID=125765 RepID=UPI003A99DE34
MVKAFLKYQKCGYIPNYPIRNKIGNGQKFRFWKDCWVGNTPLCVRFNRIYHLDPNPDCLVADKWVDGHWTFSWSHDISGGRSLSMIQEFQEIVDPIVLSNDPDSKSWAASVNSTFSVKCIRDYIDNLLLPSHELYTRWVKILPRKINVFVWRMAMDRLPTHLNLSKRGLEIDTIGCRNCNPGIESLNHTLFSCDIALEIWRKVGVWFNCGLPIFSSWSDWLSWYDNWHVPVNIKCRLYVVMATSA